MLSKVFSGAFFSLSPPTLAQSLKPRKCKVLACAFDGRIHKEGHKQRDCGASFSVSSRMKTTYANCGFRL